MEYHAPPWYQDGELTKAFLSDLTREISQLPFGSSWPDAVPVRSDCVPYAGDYDARGTIHYWVYRCRSERPGARRTDYTYFLGEDERPTLERVRYAITAPPDARAEDWQKIRTALLESLQSLGPMTWRDRESVSIGVARNWVVEVELVVTHPDTSSSSNFTVLSFPKADSGAVRSYGHSGKSGAVMERMKVVQEPKPLPPPSRRIRTTVDSLIVNCFSSRLAAETHQADWDIVGRDPPELETVAATPLDDRHLEVIRELRAQRSELASVLESRSLSSENIRIVNSEVSRVRAPGAPKRDLVLYAAHLWANQVVGYLTGEPWRPCQTPGADSILVREFNTAFSSPDRSRIECGHYENWWYSGGFIDSLAARPGTSRWADHAFLDRMKAGWNVDYGCSDDPAIGSEEFRPVIERGEAYLKSFPNSAIAPEIRLLVAEAHETAWSLAKDGGDGSGDWTRHSLEAPAHRTRAIELYEKQLEARPDDPRNAEIRRRLRRVRIDVDTGYKRYSCFSC